MMIAKFMYAFLNIDKMNNEGNLHNVRLLILLIVYEGDVLLR